MKQLSGRIIWPAYFDSTKKRKQGRRLPLKTALENPTTAELLEVCKGLSLKAEIMEGKNFPRSWWEGGEPILVETAGTKSKLLAHIAVKIRELRQSSRKEAGESQKKSKRK